MSILGALFGDTKQSSTQQTTNQQVGISGGGVGISGAGLNVGAGGQVSIVSGDSQVATAAINASQQIASQALETANQSQAHAADLIAQVQAGANQVALTATPVSAGEVAAVTSAQMKPILIVAAIGAGLLILLQFSKN